MSVKAFATTCLSLVSVACISAVTMPVKAVTLLPSDATVEGKSIAEWTVDWWQWAVSETNDIFTDPSSGVNQSGPVYFLTSAGYFGENIDLDSLPASEPIARSYNVPKDKYLLIPIVNLTWSAREMQFDESDFNDPATAMAVRDQVISDVDKITNPDFLISDPPLSAEINGVSLSMMDIEDRRYAAPLTYNAVPGNSFGIPEGFSGPTYADGYWLMIAPPGHETLTINVRGLLPEVPNFSAINPPNPQMTNNNFVVNTSDTVTGVTVPEPTSNFGILAVGVFGLVSAFKYKQKV